MNISPSAAFGLTVTAGTVAGVGMTIAGGPEEQVAGLSPAAFNVSLSGVGIALGLGGLVSTNRTMGAIGLGLFGASLVSAALGAAHEPSSSTR